MTIISHSAAMLGTTIESIPDRFYWLLSKGRLRPAEPLFAVQILSRESGEIVAEGEHDDPVECIRLTLSKISGDRVA